MVSRLALALALVAGSATASAAATTTIGTAAAVNPASTSAAPGQASRIIRIGNKVVRDERISTSAAGSVQLLFVDRTTMSIGPNSDVVLDSYVYNPSTSTGRMAVTFGKGLMRFVGGEVTHNGEADIRTTAGVIGIRGGVVLLEAGHKATGNADQLKITVAFGHAFLRTASGSITVSPGQTALVGPGGHVTVRLTTTADVRHHNSAMERGAGRGGVHLTPGIVAAQLGNGGSGTLAPPPVPAPGNATSSSTANGNASTQPVPSSAVQTTSTTQGTHQAGGSGGGTNGGGGGVSGGGVFALSMSNCCTTSHPTSQVPYMPSNAPIPLSAVLGFKPAAAGVIGGLPVIQAGVGIDGAGAGQTSTFMVMAGVVQNGKLSGDFFASGRGSGDLGQSVGSGAFDAAGGGGGASNAIPSSGNIQSTAASISNGGGALPAAPTSYSFTQKFSRITPPAGLGKVRPDISTTPYLGFAGGIMDTINTAKGTTQHYSVGSGFAGFFLLADRASGFVYSFADVQKVDGGGSAAFDGVYGFGFDASTSAKNFYRGAYVDGDHFAALDARGNAGKPLSLVNGTTVKEGAGGMVSAGMANLSQLSNYHPCKCEYTKWGFWAVHDVRPGGKVEDRSHLMEWVAGQMTDPTGGNIPTAGKASYAGHVVASIQNGNAAYVAAGRFNSTVDFGASTGTVAVGKLDGVNYRGKIALNPGNRATFGTVKDMVGRSAATNAATKLRMAAQGAFFGPKAHPVKEMGGNVTIRGLTPGGQRYLGSGIFAAAK